MKLKELGDYFIGLTYKPDDVTDDGTIVLRSGNIQEGKFDLSDIVRVNKKIRDKLYVRPGDVLMCSRNGSARLVGKSTVIPRLDEPMTFGAFMTIFRTPYNDYLRYFLQSNDFRRQLASSKTTTINQITINMLDNIDIELPEERIREERCQRLELIQRIIDARRKELDTLDELIKARFVELFGDGHDGVCKTERLGDFCKFQQGTQVPVEDQIEEKKEGYTRFLRIVDYTQAPQEPRYVSVKGREITEDSVVIVRYGATAGFVGHGYSGILANNLFEVVPDEAVLSKDFLYLALKYGTFEKEVHDKAFGAAMPALSFGMMNDIGVVTPDPSEQSGFVGFVKQVDKSKVV